MKKSMKEISKMKVRRWGQLLRAKYRGSERAVYNIDKIPRSCAIIADRGSNVCIHSMEAGVGIICQ